MTDGAAAAAPLAASSPHLPVLRGAFARAGFSTEAVSDALHTTTLSAREADRVVGRLRLAGRDDAFATLVRLFVLLADVDEDRVATAIAPLALDELAETGLVVRDGARVRALVRVIPHDPVLLIADLQHEAAADTPSDFVAGVQGPSVTLAKLTVRRPVRSVLDVGTGCGIQALLASSHGGRVVATDVNERALSFAAAAAALNGVGNVDFRAGAGFEPVAGERFDLVVANPPYVISPESAYAYRDSGLRGDAISRQFVESIPEHLAEGGFGHVLVSWVVGADGDWERPIREWVEDSGCDAWLLHYGTDDPLTHAAKWLRPLADDDLARYEQALDRWLAYLRELGAHGIAYGAVVLRRRSDGPNWIRVDEFPVERLGPAGEHVEAVFAAGDALQQGGDEGLLAARLELEPRHTLRSTLRLEEGELVAIEHVLRLGYGMAVEFGLDDGVVPLLARFDGSSPVEDVLAEAAAAAGADPGRYPAAALPVVRRLYELGFLRPAR